MNKGDEFFELLSPIKIDSTMDSDTINKQLQPIANWLFQNTPTKLYRFVSGSERSINQFINDEVWGSRASTFNDPFECLPSIDIKKIDEDLRKTLDLESVKNFFDAVRNGYRLPQMKLASESMIKTILDMINNPTFDEQLEANFSYFCAWIEQWWNNVRNEVVDSFFKTFDSRQKLEYITCFSENRDATLMWAHYANSHKGFCLEYNWNKRLLSQSSGCLIDNTALLEPVKYSDKRFDASSFVYSILEGFFKEKMNLDIEIYFNDSLAFTKVLLTKSLDWSYEKEWRLFSFDSEAEPCMDYKKILIERPTAVYLGAKMPQKDADLIEQICIKKGIPCYKMVQSRLDNRFIVEPELYSDFKKKNAVQNSQ